MAVAFVVEALDRGILDGAVHALDLSVGPRMPRLGEPVLDVDLGEGELEGLAQERLVLGVARPKWSETQPDRLMSPRKLPWITAGCDLVSRKSALDLRKARHRALAFKCPPSNLATSANERDC